MNNQLRKIVLILLNLLLCLTVPAATRRRANQLFRRGFDYLSDYLLEAPTFVPRFLVPLTTHMQALNGFQGGGLNVLYILDSCSYDKIRGLKSAPLTPLLLNDIH